MVKVHANGARDADTEFDPEAAEYYPAACCELLHVRNAVLASTTLQIAFCCLLGVLYMSLDSSGFLRAVDICRLSMVFLFVCNAIGLMCAFIGVLQERLFLVHLQTTILTGLVVLADLLALCLVLIMAVGKKNYATAQIPGVFVDTDKVEYVLGPFWIYLIAIMLHMSAAGTMCFIGVYNRYARFLKQKFDYNRLAKSEASESSAGASPTATRTIVVNADD